MKYFMHVNGQQMGPFEESELLANGLTPETSVWCEGMANWQPANQVPALAYLVGGQQQPPQAPAYQAPAYQQPAYQQPQYGYQQPQPAMPDTHMVMAILVTLFCCLPLGIVGIVKAAGVSSSYNAGRYQEAQQASDDAKKWSMWGLIAGVVFYVIYILFVVVVGLGAAASGY